MNKNDSSPKRVSAFCAKHFALTHQSYEAKSNTPQHCPSHFTRSGSHEPMPTKTDTAKCSLLPYRCSVDGVPRQ
jgi:hypothetical protein